MTTSTTSTPTSRRRFVQNTVAVGLGFNFIPAYLTSARAADNPKLPPSRRINLGCIGIGGRAGSVIPGLTADGIATPVAFTDVDFVTAKSLEKNLKAFPDVKRFTDFRVMLDKMGREIDGVVIGTPDHTHAVIAMEAMRRGKHVYCEKPLAHSIHEVRKLMAAAHKHKIVSQLGNQGHSSDTIRRLCEWVWAGAIGPVHTIHASCDAFKMSIARSPTWGSCLNGRKCRRDLIMICESGRPSSVRIRSCGCRGTCAGGCPLAAVSSEIGFVTCQHSMLSQRKTTV